MAPGWGTVEQATQLTSVTDTEQFFDDKPTLDPNQCAHVQVEVDFPATPTDNAIVSLYGAVEATPDYSDIPLDSFEIENDTDPARVDILVPPGIKRFRIGVKATGATDSLTADMDHSVGTLS